MKSKRWWLLLSSLVMVGLLVAGCAPAAAPTPPPAPTATPAPPKPIIASPTPILAPTPTKAPPTPTKPAVVALTPGVVKPKYGGTLVLANREDLPATDPMWQRTITLGHIVGTMWPSGNLMRAKSENIFDIEPYLVKKWSMNPEATVYTLEFRDDIRWHDGTKFTAADAKFWIDLSVTPPKGRRPSVHREFFGPITKVEVVDPLTLKVTFSTPQPQWLAALSTPVNKIAHPRHLMQPEIDKGNVNVSPDQVGWVGLGPFKFKEYRRGGFFRVVRNPDYFLKDESGQPLPYLDGIDFIIFTDPSTMVAAFRAGRLDGTARGSGYHLMPEQIAGIQKDLGDKAWFGEIVWAAWSLSPNSRKEPWTDVNLRKAASLWIDRPSGLKAIHGGLAKVGAMYAPGSPFANPDVLSWPGFRPDKTADRAEAKKLIEAGGYKGRKVRILTRDLWIHWGDFLVTQLKELGLSAEMEIVDTATRTQRMNDGAFEIVITTPHGVQAKETADRYSPRNRAADVQFDDSKYEELLDKLAATGDFAQLCRLAQEIERYVVLEKAYNLSLWWETAFVAYRSYVKGLRVPVQDVNFNVDNERVWLDK